MPENRIVDLFRVRRRFLRSANLERDFDDAAALEGYVLTPQAAEYLSRMSAGLAVGSGLRAWRVTGDYGVGKSSFALLLSHALGGRVKSLPPTLRSRVEAALPAGRRGRLHPVLVTGTRDSVAIAILRALERSLDKLHTRGRRPKVLGYVQELLGAASGAADAAVVRAIEDAAEYVRSSGHASGLLVVLDELGKFLEYAAASPDRQDVYFLQLLGEAAARSGDTPLVVVGLLHQGFSAYADRLTEAAQREWQKVAGRFEEMLFDRPLEQTAGLVADAMNLRVADLPRTLPRRAADDMAAVARLGWYGPGERVRRMLPDLAARLYPLHPTVLPVLARLFSRYGQNERSLFSFLLSQEPFGLQAFAEAKPAADRFYRLHDLYDYVRATLGHRLSAQSYRSHWSLIESVVESVPAEHAVEAQVLKTVAVLNLVDDQGLLPTTEVLQLAVQSDQADGRRVKLAVEKLDKKRVLYFRGASGGYCLWPHTSVNIDNAFQRAVKAVGPVRRVSSLIADEFDTRPVVARRHYIKTGNLRHFTVRCVAVDELPSVALDPVSSAAADGLIVVALCETSEDRRTAITFAQSDRVRSAASVLVAVPRPLEMLQSMLLVARRWQWVSENTEELVHDRYAAEEVSRQVASSRRILRDRIQDLVGLRGFSTTTELDWFHKGEPLEVRSGPDLLLKLSIICDEIYSSAPRVLNELVNRREISSAAAAARMRLIEGLIKSSAEPLLGMDERKKPPEMSMYLSVLRRGNMHVAGDGGAHVVVEPPDGADPLNLRPAFGLIMDALRRDSDARVAVASVFDELRRPPFGVRDGLLPLLLTVFVVIHEEELALYEDGGFVRELSGEVFQRLIKVPGSFELQYCRVSGVRATVFAQIAKLLEADGAPAPGTGVLEVVRPLCQFAAQLPQYAHRTRRVSPPTAAVRAALVAAKEPATLIFQDLPVACGHKPFGDEGREDETSVRAFVSTLKHSMDELRGIYPLLLDGIREEFRRAFGRAEPFAEARPALATTAQRLLIGVHDPRLRGFCLRLADKSLGEREWVQAFAGYVAGKAPTAWVDTDVDRFNEELHRLAHLFNRVEAAAFGALGASGASFSARVSVTLGDGSDVARVLHLTAGEEVLASSLEAQLSALLSGSRRVGLAAAARVLMKELQKS